jgi:hypothetical protein
MSARDDILGGIRQALGRGALAGEAAGALAARVAAHRRNLIRRRASTSLLRWPKACRRR